MEKVFITPIEQYVIDRVREIRIEKNLSQRELADMIDVSFGFIGKVESSGKRAKYNLQHINDIAKAFNLSPKEFLPDKAF